MKLEINMNPKISILMANYNNDKYIFKAIESVINQTYNNWELIIIDDCSTDNSVKLINKYLSNKRIKFFKNNINIGYIKTLKKLVEKSNSNILCILDSDDAIKKDALSEIAIAYKNNPDCGFIYSQCYYCDEKLKPVHVGFSKKIPSNKTNLHFNSVHHFKTFKKSDYLKTTGYDEDILFAEDIDLTLKIEEVSKLYFIDKILYYYRVLPKSQTHSFKNTQINRSSTALAKLNAYKRRLRTDILNLNSGEISEVLFFGCITSFLACRFKLTHKFIINLLKINCLFFLDYRFYLFLFKKTKKIIKLKKQKPFLSI